jgi:hypothetical protein
VQCAHGGSLISTSGCDTESRFAIMEFQLDLANGHHTGNILLVKEVKTSGVRPSFAFPPPPTSLFCIFDARPFSARIKGTNPSSHIR